MRKFWHLRKILIENEMRKFWRLRKIFVENKCKKSGCFRKTFEGNKLEKFRTRPKDFDNIHTLFKIHEWDVMKNSNCLEIKVVLKMCQTVFLNQGWLQIEGWLQIKVNSWVALKSRLFSKCARTRFLNTA